MFDKNGFTICPLHSQLEYEDWFKDELVRKTFFPEVCKALEDLFGTTNVQVFEYRVKINGLVKHLDVQLMDLRFAGEARRFRFRWETHWIGRSLRLQRT